MLPLDIVDFHNHYVPKRFEVTAGRTAPASQRSRWAALSNSLGNEELLLRDVREGDLAARVVNIPAALIADADGLVPHETIRAINDDLADLVARHPGRLHGLASVDAYDGDRSGLEAERAIRDLGHRGLFVDCARGDRLIDAQEARATLEVAAKLGVPVFVHPVAPEALTRQMAPYGLVGTLFARGTVNSAALIALVESGVFEELPDLRVVVTELAFGGLALTAGLSPLSLLPEGTHQVLRDHVWIDTMCFHPALIRASVDLLGVDHVLVGSDWPILNDKPLRGRVMDTLHGAGLSDQEQRAIAAGNSLALLGIRTDAAPRAG